MPKETCFVELRPGQGGDDSKLLINEMVGIYARAARLWSL